MTGEMSKAEFLEAMDNKLAALRPRSSCDALTDLTTKVVKHMATQEQLNIRMGKAVDEVFGNGQTPLRTIIVGYVEAQEKKEAAREKKEAAREKQLDKKFLSWAYIRENISIPIFLVIAITVVEIVIELVKANLFP